MPRMRALLLAWLGGALLGCAAPRVVEEAAVAVRPPRGPDDSALVLSYPATLCSVTLRDESGTLHDREERVNGSVPVDMTRSVPDEPWVGYSGPPPLLTVLALPPGRYTLIRYATSDEWERLSPDEVPPRARTDCTSSSLTTHPARISLRIEPGKLTLLDLPGGITDFPALRRMSQALRNPYVTSTVGPWLPAVRRTGTAMHRELAERQRQPHAGYDVYPGCDGKVAVVRRTGTPFDWYEDPENEAIRRAFRARVHPPLPMRSLQATGFGRGCVMPLAFVYLLTDSAELEPLARALGEMMVEKDLAGELDLILTGPIDPLPENDD